MAAKIFLEVLSDVNDNKVQVTIETYVTLFVYRYIRCGSNILVYLIRSQTNDNPTSITVDISSIQSNVINLDSSDFENEEASLLNFPVIVNDKCVIAGLCGVCRGLLKLVNSNATKKLLGFKESCLQAPSENSTWTKFCEIDFINCTKKILELNDTNFEGRKSFLLSDEFAVFEKHLSLPVRIHNVYKVARNLAKENKTQVEFNLPQRFEKLSVDGRERVPRLNKQRKPKVSLNLSNRISSLVGEQKVLVKELNSFFFYKHLLLSSLSLTFLLLFIGR